MALFVLLGWLVTLIGCGEDSKNQNLNSAFGSNTSDLCKETREEFKAILEARQATSLQNAQFAYTTGLLNVLNECSKYQLNFPRMQKAFEDLFHTASIYEGGVQIYPGEPRLVANLDHLKDCSDFVTLKNFCDQNRAPSQTSETPAVFEAFRSKIKAL